MSSRIGTGTSGFGHHKQFGVDGRVGADPGMARLALAQLMDVNVDEISTPDSLLSDL